MKRRSKERHGHSRTPEYKAWQGMIDRCTNPSNQRFHRYGGRGITVSNDWIESFAAFLECVGLRPTPEHSLDRIHNDGNYKPGNVKWSTKAEQIRNTTRNIYLEYEGRKMILADWSKEVGINFYTLLGRIKAGWSVERVLFVQPLQSREGSGSCE